MGPLRQVLGGDRVPEPSDELRIDARHLRSLRERIGGADAVRKNLIEISAENLLSRLGAGDHLGVEATPNTEIDDPSPFDVFRAKRLLGFAPRRPSEHHSL